MSDAPWKKIVSEKRAALAAKIPAAWRLSSVPDASELRNSVHYPRQFMSERAYAITETLDAQVLLKKIASGEYSSLEVTEAFSHRAAIAQQLVNPLTEILFEEAAQRAKELDEYLRTNKKTVGPLHGLPVSLKDAFRVRGTNAAIGIVAYIGDIDTPDTEALIVKELRELGAIIYVKTTTPTAVSHIDCFNNITGQSYSPTNRLMSSGASSGGEGALTGSHGSIIGLSTDIGGSSRVPAAVNGVYGLRTSVGRLPYLGVKDLIMGNHTSPFTVGPIGPNLSSLKVILQAILSTQPWVHDPKTIPLPWREERYEEVVNKARSGGLVFGLLLTDGVITPQPPQFRTLKEVKALLEAAGHEVVEWAPPVHAEAANDAGTIFGADGGKAIHEAMAASGEPNHQLVRDYFGDAPTKGLSAPELFAKVERRWQLQVAYAEYWNTSSKLTKSGRPVDFVITPAFQASSFRPGQAGPYLGYTTIANNMDLTAIILPASRVDKNIDLPNSSFKPIDQRDALNQSYYNPEDFDGGPVAIQLIGRRLDEERVLAAAGVVDEVIRANSKA